jgi:outer membrane protein TolC
MAAERSTRATWRQLGLCHSLAVLACGGVLAGLAGCGHQRRAVSAGLALERQEQARLYSGLSAPLVAGQLGLDGVLDRIHAEFRVFNLRDGGTPQPLAKSQDLSDPALLICLASDGPTGRRWWYLDPAALRLVPLETDASTDGVDAAGCFRRQGERLTVVRSLPVGALPTAFAGRARIMTADLICEADGTPLRVDSHWLTELRHRDTQPLFAADGSVVFLRQSANRRDGQLLRHDGERARNEPLLTGAWAGTELRHLRRLADGRLVFAATHAGRSALWEWSPGQEPQAFRGAIPAPQGPGDVLLTLASDDGRLVPALRRLPSELTLAQALALAEARHPAINRRRALLAAALAEARTQGPGLWPTFNISLLHTAAENVLVEGVAGATTDYLAAGLSRGVLGVAQPLLEWDRDVALQEAALLRAEVARDLLAAEINERLAEVAESHQRLAHLERRLALEESIADIGARRIQHARDMGELGLALDADGFAALAVSHADRAELVHLRQQAERHRRLLASMLDLGDGQGLRVLDEAPQFERQELPDPDSLRRTALLNQPRLRAGRHAVLAGFHADLAGNGPRPSLTAGAEYGLTTDSGEPINDYVGLSLTGSLPTRWLAQRRPTAELQAALTQARALDHDEQARLLAAEVELAHGELLHARERLARWRAETAEARERSRLAELHLRYGLPPSTPGEVVDNALVAQLRYLQSLRQECDGRLETAVRHGRLQRILGTSRLLAADLAGVASEQADRSRPATWVWRSEPLLRDGQARARFLAWVARLELRRAYLYLGARGEQANDEAGEQLARLVDSCAARDCAAWALLGEPDWLQRDDPTGADEAVATVLAWNARRAAWEPRLAGLKLDLEPHALPAWQDATGRAALMDRYLAILDRVRAALPPDLPLWVDVPPQFFNDANASLRRDLAERVDGATLMAYDADPAVVRAFSRRALAQWAKPLETGLEFAPGAPAGETLAELDTAGRRALCAALQQDAARDGRWVGVALHDYEHLDPQP